MEKCSGTTCSNNEKTIAGLSQAELSTVAKANIFKNITETELSFLLKCLLAVKKDFDKENFIINAGDPMSRIGIVISGSVDIIQEDAVGRRTILTTIKRPDVFGEGIVAAKIEESPVSVVAAEKTSVLFLDYRSMIEKCEKNCVFHSRLIENMLELMSKKLIMLNKKLSYSLMKTIREKVSSYLVEEYGKNKNRTFIVPYNREELANYFSVDRSSLSRELSQMQDEGLIEYNKSQFTLTDEFFTEL
jgi:CRP-like cAMP-binding protein